ncbi:MAG TPA: hypothetical protein VMN58_09785 [Acidimicrobiales bacterium]|nr:hypothetical protein [Acidimicrobiales bacterium]
MAGERYVVLGVARPRAEWFRAVGQWATSAIIPAEFLKCVSGEELRARLAAGRAYSAVLVDGTMPAVDRDLVETARDAGCVVFVVDDGRAGRDWAGLGATAVLPPSFTREALLDALATHAALVSRGAVVPSDGHHGGTDLPSWRGNVVVVCGAGGTGASTVAAALAQGLGHDDRSGGDIVLADMALQAEQAMLHDVRDVVPGIQELVEVHRSRRPSPDEVRHLTFSIVERRYHLLLGLRRARYWATLRPRSLEAAFESLRRTFATVVCDVAADVEGEDGGGSADVEERNLLARTAVGAADVVFVVGRPGVKGTHSLVRVMSDLVAVGVPAGRLVPVYNLAPRQPRARAELSATLAELAVPAMGGGHSSPPIFLPSRKVEEALRDAVGIPAPLPGLLAGAFHATLERVGPATTVAPVEPELVTPGSLGAVWGEEAG